MGHAAAPVCGAGGVIGYLGNEEVAGGSLPVP